MKNFRQIPKKIMSIFVACALLCQLVAISLTATAIHDDIGQKDYTIKNPYEAVNWDKWTSYLGATHVHSHLSDGSEDFDEMVNAYYTAGYDCLSMTDHGTVNYGWTAKKPRHTIFSYQTFVHGSVSPLTEARNREITTGVGRNGRKMIDVPFGIELNGSSAKKVHVNSFFAAAGDGDMALNSTWPADAVEKSHNAGGLSHINHVGEWSGGKDSAGVYDSAFINKFADVYKAYSSCVGMELVNTGDGRTKNDRYLYDETLKILAPIGRNLFGFCEDDSHDFSDIGRNAQVFWMPDNTVANVRTCMETGAFFACSKNARTPDELGDGFSATAGSFPSVSKISVDELRDQITVNCKDATKVRMVADGRVIKTYDVKASGDTVTFDLNAYENQIGSYVRIYLTGAGGICYAQPFLLTAKEFSISTVQFTLPSTDSSVVVNDSNGAVVQPVNEKFRYVLDAGTYSYTCARPGYKTKTEQFTVTDADIANGVQKKIAVTLDDDPNILSTCFYVPETIYLQPTTDKMDTFQFYADRANAKEGALTRTSNDIEGNIYFNCPEAKNVTITVDSLAKAATNGGINFKTGYSVANSCVSTSVTAGALETALAPNTGTTLKWTAKYTLSDGNTYELYAYSYVYAPQTGEVAAAISQIHTASTDVSNNGVLWSNGFHSVTGGDYSCLKNFFTDVAPTGNTDISGWFSGMAGGGTAYGSYKHSSNAGDSHNVQGGMGTLAVDSSRYTNLSQIPNLKVGFWQCNIDGDDAARGWIKQAVDSRETMLRDFSSGVGLGGIYNGGLNVENGIGYVGGKSVNLSAYTNTARGNRKNDNYYSINLAVTYASKDLLRMTYNSAIKDAHQAGWYTDASFNTYIAKLQAAGTILGKPNATADEINIADSELKAAINALTVTASGVGTAVINHYIENSSGKLLGTSSQNYVYGDRINAVANDYKGYSFANSWKLYTDNATTLLSVGETPTTAVFNAMHTSYNWEFFYSPNKYSATFDVNGGDTFAPEGGTGTTAVYDSDYKLPQNTVTRTGYDFGGWRLAGTDTILGAGSTFKWDIDANGVFVAQWLPKTYAITFDVDGGDEYIPTGGTGITAKYDTPYDLPTNIPTKTGYSFGGWLLTNSSVVYTPSSTIIWTNSNEGTFKAQWSPFAYNVKFIDGLNGASSTTIPATYGSEIILPTYEFTGFSRVGYRQTGWSVNGTTYQENAKVKNLIAENNATVTVTAVWTANGYTVTFDANGGVCSTQSKIVLSAETYGDLPIPSRTGFSFGGWYTVDYYDNATVDSIKKVDSTSIVEITDNQTLFAYWTVNQCGLIINPNGGLWNDSSSNSTVTKSFDSTYTVSVPSRVGYTFGGWLFSGDGTWDSTTALYTFSGIDGIDDVLTASWTANTYTVILDANAGYCETPNKSVTYDDTYGLLPMATRIGFTFGGWYTVDYLDNEPIDISKKITPDTRIKIVSDQTLFAYWTTNSYTVSINPNGGLWNNSASTSNVTQEYNTTYILNDPSRNGYTFVGWEFNGDGGWNGISNVYTFNGTDSTDDILSANWRINQYSVSVNPNGGRWKDTTASTSITQDYNSTCLIENPVRTGYSFGGWIFSGDGNWNETTGIYTFSGTDAANDALTATWKRSIYTVTFQDVKGNVLGTSQVNHGTIITEGNIPANALEQSGTEWYTDKELMIRFNFGTVAVTDNVTLYANVKTKIAPSATVIENSDDIKTYLADKSEKPANIESFGNISYVLSQGADYNYYCYTNDANPLMIFGVSDDNPNGAVSFDAINIKVEVVDKSAGVTVDGNNGIKYASYENNYLYETLTPEFVGTDKREYVAYKITVTDAGGLHPDISSLLGGNGIKTAADGSFTLCISYFKTSPTAKTNFTANDKWENMGYIYRDVGSVQAGELVNGNDSAYVADDPVYGRKGGIGCSYYMLDSTTDSSAISKYFAGNQSEALSEINSGIANGSRTVSDWIASDTQSVSANTTPQNVNKNLAYVHILDRWGNVFDSLVSLPNIDNSVPEGVGSVVGVLNIDENGGSGVSKIDIYEYSADVSPTVPLNFTFKNLLSTDAQQVNGDGSVDAISGTFVICLDGKDVSANNGRFTVIVTDAAGNKQTFVANVASDGMLTINVNDAFNMIRNQQTQLLVLNNSLRSSYALSLNSKFNVNLCKEKFDKPSVILFPSMNTSTVIDRTNNYIYGLNMGINSLDGYAETTSGHSVEYVRTGNGFGTGTVVNVMKNQIIVESYTVVIFGDLDGNGMADGSDSLLASLITAGLMTQQSVGSAAYLAADANHDGTVDGLDAYMLEMAGLLLANVEQTGI